MTAVPAGQEAVLPGKFVVLDAQSVPDADYGIEARLLEEAGIETVLGNCSTSEEILQLARDADGIGLLYVTLDADTIAQLERCRVIVRYGVGYDSIDVAAASEHGIAVCNLPDYCQEDVATHTIAMVLDLCRKVTLFDRRLREGHWNENWGYPVHRLSALVLGLVGFGHIAQETARLAKALGLTVVATDPVTPVEVFQGSGVERVSWEELLKNSDIISLHVPLTQGTHHLIDAEAIASMKEGVMLVNTARGPVIALDDLMAALHEGRVRAAALDVVEGEPINDAGHPIWDCPNLIVNPHSAYYSIESGVEQHQKVARSAIAVLVEDEVPYNCVNRRDLLATLNEGEPK